MKVLVYPQHPSDPVKEATIDGATELDRLRALQHMIGGYVEPIRTTNLQAKKNLALVDEDARHKNRMVNFRATSAIGYPVPLRGTVVIVGDEPNATWGDYHE